MHYLISIGVILAITGIVLIYWLKDPLRQSDKLLIAILSAFVVKFLLDEVDLITGNPFIGGIAAVFGVSSIVTCGWYIKFITDSGSGFGWKEIRLYIPLIVLLGFIVTFMLAWPSSPHWLLFYNLVLWVMIGLIVYYFYFCIQMLRKHRRLIREYYSGQPGNITVNWIIVIIGIQITEFVLKGVLAHIPGPGIGANMQIITNEYCFIIETFLLVVLGIWQNSIPVLIGPAGEPGEEQPGAVLQGADLGRYQQKIEQFMDSQKPYLDPELTIEKLSDLTRIRKALLSQTLNKGLNKNFFTFVKEYRIRHVEQLLKNKTHGGESIMDIAYESGFNSKTAFNRAFKEVTGKTPTEYLGK